MVKNENIKLLYVALGSLMLVMLQTLMFQNALGLSNLVRIIYLGDVVFFVARIISFVGVIIFITSAIKLIKNNIR